jgi:hypothetical protein
MTSQLLMQITLCEVRGYNRIRESRMMLRASQDIYNGIELTVNYETRPTTANLVWQ